MTALLRQPVILIVVVFFFKGKKVPMKTASFHTPAECLDLIVDLRLKRDVLRKIYKEVEADDNLLDWNTKGELLAEIAVRGADYSAMIEHIIAGMSFHSYPFSVLDTR
jgi:hypothetical protein